MKQISQELADALGTVKTQETLIIEAVLRIIEGKDAEITISALTKVLQPLLVGLAKDREEASTFAEMLTVHLQKYIQTADRLQFGFLLNTTGPILHTRGRN